jgi:hypothetical protein
MVSIPKIQFTHLKNQNRLLFVMLCGSMMFSMIDPAMVISYAHDSMLYRIASLTHNRPLVSIIFLVCGLALVPYTWLHIKGGTSRHQRAFAKLSIVGLAVSGFLWAYLCFLSWKVETGLIVFVFFRQIIGSLMFAGLLAIMLNNELKREKELEEGRQVAERNLLQRLQSAIQISPHEGQDDSYAIQSYSRHAQQSSA